jgi:hypothetical protein
MPYLDRRKCMCGARGTEFKRSNTRNEEKLLPYRAVPYEAELRNDDISSSERALSLRLA